MTIRRATLPRDLRLWRGLNWPSLGLALALAVVQIGGSIPAAHGQPDRKPVDALAVVLLAAGPTAITARRRHPSLTVWAVNAITLLYMLLGYPYGPVLFSPIVAMYAAVSEGRPPPPRAWPCRDRWRVGTTQSTPLSAIASTKAMSFATGT